MRWGPILFVLTLVFGAMASAVRADEPTTAVIYVNGVSKPKDDAWKSVKELQKRLASEPGLEFGLAYNQTACPDGATLVCIPDLYETIFMEIETDVSQFMRFLSRLVPLPEFFQDALNELAASFDASLITNDDLEEHIDIYETKFLQGRKVVVVSHSQGNFFANQAFPLLGSDNQDSFGIVSVAHPDRPVEGDDRPFFDDHHTTLTLDLVITCLIVNCVPGAEFFDPLPRNVSNGINFADLSGHSFVKSYLRDGSNSESKILADIIDVKGLLTQPDFGVSFTPSISGSGRGVAFDSDTGRLYYTIRQSKKIFITDASNSPATLISPGVRFGALAWDAKRGVLWGGAYQATELGNVYQITPAGVATFQFNFVPPGGNCYGQIPGRFDGLAYDEGPTSSNSDDSLWVSDDAGFQLHHIDLNGNLIASFTIPPNPRSGRPGCNTGIAVDGDFLWLALQSGPDQAPHDIVKVAKSDPTTVLSSFAFSNSNVPGPEDLELDLVTVPGTAALWSNQFGSPNVLKLWKLRSTGMM